MDLYITEAEFAERYGVSRHTAQRWRVSGEGPPFVRMGMRKIVYRISDCEKWAEARTFRSRADEYSRK